MYEHVLIQDDNQDYSEEVLSQHSILPRQIVSGGESQKHAQGSSNTHEVLQNMMGMRNIDEYGSDQPESDIKTLQENPNMMTGAAPKVFNLENEYDSSSSTR